MPNIGSELNAADQAFASALHARLPTPSPIFRRALGSRIEALDPGYGPRPEHLWVRAGVFVAVGVVLMVIALLMV